MSDATEPGGLPGQDGPDLIDMGYLSLPEDVQRAAEEGLRARQAPARYRPRRVALEAWQAQHEVTVQTYNGPVAARPGDWIVRGTSAFMVYGDEAFRRTYEPAGAETPAGPAADLVSLWRREAAKQRMWAAEVRADPAQRWECQIRAEVYEECAGALEARDAGRIVGQEPPPERSERHQDGPAPSSAAPAPQEGLQDATEPHKEEIP